MVHLIWSLFVIVAIVVTYYFMKFRYSDDYYEFKIFLLLNFIKFKSPREFMLWGTYGKDGKQPLKWVLFKDMANEHIENILKTQSHVTKAGNFQARYYHKQLLKELEFRKKNPQYNLLETIS